MKLGRGNPVAQDATLRTADRARAHAQEAEHLLDTARGSVQGLTRAAAHATLAVYYQREAEEGR